MSIEVHRELGFEHTMPGVTGDVTVVSPAHEQLEELRARAERHLEVAENLGVALHALPGDTGKHFEDFVVAANQQAELSPMPETEEEAVIADEVAIQEMIGGDPGSELAAVLNAQPDEPLMEALRETEAIEGDEAIKTIIDAMGSKDVDPLAEYYERQEREARLLADVKGLFTADTGEMITGANDFINRSLVHREQTMKIVLELAGDDVKPQDLVANGQRFLDAIEKLDEAGDNCKAGRDMLVKLIHCEGFQVLDEDSALVDKLIADPEACRARVDLITSRWHEVAESGCPPDIASGSIRQVFNKYSYQNRRREEGKSLDETLLDDCNWTFDAITVLGVRGYEAKKRRPNGANDGYIGALAYEMQYETFDDAAVAAIRAKLEHFVTAYDMAAEVAPVTVEMSQRSDFGMMSIDNLASFAQALEGTAMRETKLLALSGEAEASFHASVFSTLRASYEALEKARLDGKVIDPGIVTHSIDIAYDVHTQEPRYPLGVMQLLLSETGSAADDAAARLLNPNVIAHLDRSERDRDEILRAVTFIEHGNHDIDNLLRAYDGTNSPLRGLLLEMGRAEPRNSEDRAAYYSMLTEEMQKLDKNGTPYSSPDSVAHIARCVTTDAWFDTQANVDWYRSDNLPLAAFDTVVAVRERVVAKGVPDTPTAIYEAFCHSPELIAEMSGEHLGQYTAGQMEMAAGYKENYKIQNWANGKDAPKVIETAHAMAEQRADSFRIFLNIGQEALVSAAAQGSIKSIMDTDVIDYDAMEDRGARYVFHRSKVELMMGNRSRGDSMHPIYGSCGFVDRGIPTGAVGYGNIMLSFKPSAGDLASRTTYTPEDSFHGTARLTQKDAAALRIIKNAAGCDHMHTADYVEAQVSGGLDMSLVDAIYVEDTPTAMQLGERLSAELAAKIQIRSEGYDNTIEQQAFIAQFGKIADRPFVQPQNEYTGLVAHAPSPSALPDDKHGDESYDFI